MDFAEIECLPIKDFRVEQNCQSCSGGFGEVWDAWHKKHGRVAVKMFYGLGTLSDFKKEVTIQAKACKHYNGILLRGIITHRTNRNLFGIVSDYMPAGDLNNFIHGYRQERIYSWCLAFRILHEISDAMRKLHEFSPDKRILHCDLKPANILLDRDLHAKICDFGAARFSTVSIDSIPRDNPNHVCTIEYAPLEFFDTSLRNKKYDVYSFCVIMWEICLLQKPFAGCHRDAELLKVQLRNGGLANSIDQVNVGEARDTNVLKNILRSGLQNDPTQRPFFDEISHNLRQLILGISEADIDSAVASAKQRIMSERGIQSFDVSKSRYPKPLADIFTTGTIADDIAYSEQLIPPMQAPQGDASFSSSVEPPQPPVVTDADCTRLGELLYYSDGWEMLAARMGLSVNVIEQIKEDHRKSVERKTAMFREWCRQNRSDKRRLVELMYNNNVSLDCFEFLDQDGSIRQSFRR
ncbi:ankyrin repeat and protein kinase domain-containing protein 1-like isoform X1 [Clavelina lepadiformis]|uniref:ankyrin repeat and protein kinase domain-containing protein 1-like isoform X1 n=2 Tax=Clavelina lepadiformis TaxID=159417 RepID=UPI004042DC53